MISHSILSLAVLAQATATPGAPAANLVQSVWDFLVKGGLLMIPIGLCSLVALAVIVERAISLQRRRVIPLDFSAGLKAALGPDSSDTTTAQAYCERSDSPIARILAAALPCAARGREAMERRITQAGEREVFRLRKYLRTLTVIVTAAPMLGLLGTVFGMIEAFQTVAASGEALGRTEMLAKGIYEALVTTAAGLLVAIPALIGYHWVSAKVERHASAMDAVASDVVNSIVDSATIPQTPSESDNGDGDGKLRITEEDEVSESAAEPATV